MNKREQLRASRSHLCFSLIIALCGPLAPLTPSLAKDTEPDEGIRSQPPTTRVLKNAHLVISSGREIDSGNLVIMDGKIAAIGKDVEIPAGAEVIDCEGKHVYPAFVDALVEFASDDMPSRTGYWNSSVTPERRMDQLIARDNDKLETLRRAGVGTVLAAPNSGIIKGQSCVLTTADAPPAETLLRRQAFQHLRMYPARNARERYPNSPMGATALVRQTLLDADWYQRAQQAIAADASLPQVDSNAALATLQALVRGEQSAIFDGTNELYALRADRVGREFSLKVVIRGSGREYRQLDAIADTNRTFIIPVDFPDAPKLGSEAEMLDATLQALMHWRLAPENPARLAEAGVEFVISSDGLDKPTDLLPNLRKAIEHGLSPQACLRAVTLGPAELLGVATQVGSLETGKLASLLITDSPLFEKGSEIQETWVQGVRYQWQREQAPELRGAWQFTHSNLPHPLVLDLSGKPDKLTAEIGSQAAFDQSHDSTEKAGQSKPEPMVEVKNLAVNDYQLTGHFDAEVLGKDLSGTAWLNLLLRAKAPEAVLDGSLRMPDGSVLYFSDGRRLTEGDQPASSEPKATDKSGHSDAAQNAAETESETPDKLRKAPKSADEQQRVACEINFPLGAFGRSQPPPQPTLLLVQNATLWTCGPQGTLDKADMLIRNGKIAAIGQNLEVPAGAQVLDANGLHVSPGIIDCHSHMATDGGVNESAQAITAEVRVGDFIDSNDITIYRQLAGGVTTSNILHGSANPIGGQNQVIKLRWGSLDEDLKMREAPAGIKFALGENVKQSNHSSATSRYPQSRMGVEQIMRDRFEAAKLYRQQWREWSQHHRGLPPRRDLELEAIAEILEGTRWVHCHSYRQDEILMMLELLDDYQVTIGSLQHILEGYKVADAMAKHGATGSSFSDWWAYKIEVLDAIPYNGALMHQAGVVVSFNSDDAELARHLNHEAAKAVKYGRVPPEEALKFVTLNPAKQLRIENWVGSLEVGKDADFVLWNRSPLSTLSMCLETWIDGRKYFDREEDLSRRQADERLRIELINAALDRGAGKRGADDEDDPSLWWVRYDEFCHHSHEHDEDHHLDHQLDQQSDH